MWISFLINCSIVLMVVFSCFAMYYGWNFMGKAGDLESPGLEMLRYFTIDSNILMGICSLIAAAMQASVLLGKTEKVPTIIYAIKLMGCSAVALTFLVTICFLWPHTKNPVKLFYNSNLFFHLIIPLISVFSFICLEHTDSLPFSATVLGIAPLLFYGTYYIVNVFSHLVDGKADRKYDFYNFLDGNIKRAPFAIAIILLAAYLLSVLLWCGSHFLFN